MTQDLNLIRETAVTEAAKLTASMDKIFEPFKDECEAPEWMPEYAYAEWSVLWQIRRNIFERLSRLDQVAATLNSYLFQEVI